MICDNLPLSLTQSYDNNQDEYGAPAGPVQTSNQDSYGSPSGPVQGRHIKLHFSNYILNKLNRNRAENTRNQSKRWIEFYPQTGNQYSATPVQQNQDSYGSPSGPVQGRDVIID